MNDTYLYYESFKAVEEGREHPRDYWGCITDLQDQGWVLTFGRHRDSDVLGISNYETILKLFEEKKFEKQDDYRVEGSNHWAVGWIDQIMVRALQCDCDDWEKADIVVESKQTEEWRCNTCGAVFGTEAIRPIFYECREIAARLENYPVLDEEDFSRREHEDLVEYIETNLFHAISGNEGETIAEGFTVEAEAVAEWLFDTHSVSCVDECDTDKIEEAVIALAEKEGKKL